MDIAEDATAVCQIEQGSFTMKNGGAAFEFARRGLSNALSALQSQRYTVGATKPKVPGRALSHRNANQMQNGSFDVTCTKRDH